MNMKKYLVMLKYEFKNMLRDSTSVFMIAYPFLMLFVLGFLVPKIIENTEANAVRITLLITLTMALAVGAYISGALLGFALIENKDEHTLSSIAVTPMQLSGYLIFKVVYFLVLSFLSNLILLGGLKLFASKAYVIEVGTATISLLDNLTWLHIIVFSAVNSLFLPALALLFASFAKNKIEGFALVKGGGLIIVLPVLSLLTVFQDAKQYLLGILPNFWSVKAMLNQATGSANPSNLPFYLYLLIGTVYYCGIFAVTYHIYIRKVKD